VEGWWAPDYGDLLELFVMKDAGVHSSGGSRSSGRGGSRSSGRGGSRSGGGGGSGSGGGSGGGGVGVCHCLSVTVRAVDSSGTSRIIGWTLALGDEFVREPAAALRDAHTATDQRSGRRRASEEDVVFL
jgi:hypothetical protein